MLHLLHACKGRGICPSCGGRRMVECSAHLLDHVLPRVPVRPWVLSLPFVLRLRLAVDHALCRRVHAIFARAVSGFVDSFDLHGAVAVHAGTRGRLERLCRYLLRPPLAAERLELDDEGQVRLRLKTPWNDGTTHLIRHDRLTTPQALGETLRAGTSCGSCLPEIRGLIATAGGRGWGVTGRSHRRCSPKHRLCPVCAVGTVLTRRVGHRTQQNHSQDE